MSEKSWKDIFGKKTRLNWLESEVDILRRELDSYKHFRKKDDERNYEKITKCIAKTAFVEVQIEGAVMPLKNRIGTLEQQIADGMNREEEWKRILAKIESRLIVDQMKVDGVWKEEEAKFNIDVGDLVVDKRNQTRVRTVTQLNADRIKLENGSMQGVYSGADWIIRFQFDWKLLVKKEDFK